MWDFLRRAEVAEHKIDQEYVAEGGWSRDEFLAAEKNLSNADLQAIAGDCEVDAMDPENCVPCLASVALMERLTADEGGQSSAGPGEEEIPFENADEEPKVISELLELAQRHPVEPKPVAQEFAEQVGVLQNLVQTMLLGPPIPPPNVSLDELAILAVASQKWLAIIDAQDVELAANQEQFRQAVRTLVARIRRDS